MIAIAQAIKTEPDETPLPDAKIYMRPFDGKLVSMQIQPVLQTDRKPLIEARLT
jgi:hypothetical protein